MHFTLCHALQCVCLVFNLLQKPFYSLPFILKFWSLIKLSSFLLSCSLNCCLTCHWRVSWHLQHQQLSLLFRFYNSINLFFLFFRGLAKIGEPNNISPVTGMIFGDPAIHQTLRRKQKRLLSDNPGVLVALVKGARLAINECQHQFRNRRWNCSTRNYLRGKNMFGKIVDRGKSKLQHNHSIFCLKCKKLFDS